MAGGTLSPLTGDTNTFMGGGPPSSNDLASFNDRLGRWYMSQPILDAVVHPEKDYVIGDRSFTPSEVKLGWLVVRSKLWLQQIKNLDPLCVINQPHYDGLMQRIARGETIGYTLVPLEAAIVEGQLLGFEDKCLLTLQNLHLKWQTTGTFVNTEYQLPVQGDRYQTLDLRFRAQAQEDGMAYGCEEKEAALVYQHLHKRGWIQIGWNGTQPVGWYTAPEGLVQLDRLRSSVRQNQAFFVRPWDNRRDAFFGRLRAGVQAHRRGDRGGVGPPAQ